MNEKYWLCVLANLSEVCFYCSIAIGIVIGVYLVILLCNIGQSCYGKEDVYDRCQHSIKVLLIPFIIVLLGVVLTPSKEQIGLSEVHKCHYYVNPDKTPNNDNR